MRNNGLPRSQSASPGILVEKMKRRAHVRVRPHEAGAQVLDFLTRRFTYLGREDWSRAASQGRITRNGRRIRPDDPPLSIDDVLSYDMGDLEEPPADLNYAVLWEDESLLAVAKPGNLPCHPGGRYFHHTLWALVTVRHSLDRCRLAGRLDRETSGIVLLAKTSEAARRLQEIQTSGRMVKRYAALVAGDFPSELITARGRLIPDPLSPIRKKMRFAAGDAGPGTPGACETVFRKIRGSGDFSLVAARPVTGRTHQIRATLLALGFPVVGDKLYGPDDTVFERFIHDRMTPEDIRNLRMDRQALHCASLCFPHPLTDQPVLLAAPPPPDFVAVAPDICGMGFTIPEF